MNNVETSSPGVETRLKMKQRGFYHDKSPGFAAVNASHGKAQRAAGEKKVAEAFGLDAQAPDDLRQRFGAYADLLRNKGTFAGTGHRRIVIPKSHLSEDHIKGLGFKPVVIAIPEAGQDRFSSYRHPNNLFHIHSHGDRWTMHEDRHPAATMIKDQGLMKMVAQGAPHVMTEGLPGLYYYLKGQLGGRKSTADVVTNELDPETKTRLGLAAPATKTAAAGEGIMAALGKFGLLHGKEADPVDALSELFKYEDFGLPVKGDPEKGRPQRTMRDRSFGPAAPIGSAGSAMEFSPASQLDVATTYTGA